MPDPMMNEQPQEQVQQVQQAPGPEMQAQGPEAGGMEEQVEAYAGGMLKMLHDPKSRNQMYAMLKSAPPEQSIPQTAMVITKNMEKAVGQLPPLELRFAAGTILIGELVEVYNAGGFAKDGAQIPEEKVMQIVQATFQQYIEDGVKAGTVDPVELQQLIEPMMSEEQRSQGMAAAQENGVPMEPGQEAAMETYRSEGVRAEKSKNTQAAANMHNKQRGMLQQQGGMK